MTDDARRTALYRDFQESQHGQQLEATRHAAGSIFDILFQRFRPASVLDVGCGFGAWLAIAKDKGIADVRGIEGPWIDRTKLLVETGLVDIVDLEQGFALGRRFDLIVCTEVAEHLSPPAAPRLIESLTSHSDLVLFSAAIPFQGGHHHVNEQFIGYWAERFAAQGFVPCDFIRPQIWGDTSILWWLRQNLVLFAHERALAANPALAEGGRDNRMLSVVHPDVYAPRAAPWQQYEALMNIFKQQGSFLVTMQDGRLKITRSTGR